MRCDVSVRRGGDWDSRLVPCGNKAKGRLIDGRPACGVHLRVERLASERTSARIDWDKRVAAVRQTLGISVGAWDVGRVVTVNLEDLERLVQYQTGAAGAHDATTTAASFPESTLETLAELVRDLAHSDDCFYDHHSYCQAHNWMGETECPHARAKAFLAATTDEAKN